MSQAALHLDSIGFNGDRTRKKEEEIGMHLVDEVLENNNNDNIYEKKKKKVLIIDDKRANEIYCLIDYIIL